MKKRKIYFIIIPLLFVTSLFVIFSLNLINSSTVITNLDSYLNIDNLKTAYIHNVSHLTIKTLSTSLGSPSGSNYLNGGLSIDNSESFGNALSVYSSNGNTSSSTNFVLLAPMNTSFNRPVLRIMDNSTDGGTASIRLDSPNPDIEFVETDQSSPNGKFEIAVQGDSFQLNSRNTADDSFENFVRFYRKAYMGTNRALMNMSINTSSSADYINFLNEGSSVGAYNGIVWYNSNNANPLSRISVKAGSSYQDPTMSIEISSIKIINISSLGMMITSVNVTNNMSLPFVNVECTTINEGYIFYNKSLHKPMYCNSTRWVDF